MRPHIQIEGSRVQRKLLIGVVEGDIHDIGKNLVKTMFEAAGWTIHDLGKDVRLDIFAQEQERLKADVVAVSALMTTSMLAIPKVVELIRSIDPEATILAGGRSLNAGDRSVLRSGRVCRQCRKSSQRS